MHIEVHEASTPSIERFQCQLDGLADVAERRAPSLKSPEPRGLSLPCIIHVLHTSAVHY